MHYGTGGPCRNQTCTRSLTCALSSCIDVRTHPINSFDRSQIGWEECTMRTTRVPFATGLALLILLFGLPSADAQETATQVGTDTGTLSRHETAPLYKAPGYSPYAGRNYPTRVLWGDTHLHTANSLDAAAIGNTLGSEPAYRFPRGEG